MKRKTTEERLSLFIIKGNKKYLNFYDYSSVEYINSKTKIPKLSSTQIP